MLWQVKLKWHYIKIDKMCTTFRRDSRETTAHVFGSFGEDSGAEMCHQTLPVQLWLHPISISPKPPCLMFPPKRLSHRTMLPVSFIFSVCC
jgi:hypothetical protein